ncbi:hypothetical protein [Alteromonas phage PB15]|nr:hypothetical protein [Alteromonas phage PB15]
MSEAKFTKGPWYVYNNDVYLEIVSDKGAICDTCMSGHEFDGGDCLEGKSAKANAHLIAAAPEMYAMLQSIDDLFGLLDEHTHPNIELDCQQHEIRKLLAKARGE